MAREVDVLLSVNHPNIVAHLRVHLMVGNKFRSIGPPEAQLPIGWGTIVYLYRDSYLLEE